MPFVEHNSILRTVDSDYFSINIVRVAVKYFIYRIAVLAALAMAAICGFWLWKRRRSALSDDGTSSERTSTGPWYPPPHYSRCSSFVQALPPPYNEVFKKLIDLMGNILKNFLYKIYIIIYKIYLNIFFYIFIRAYRFPLTLYESVIKCQIKIQLEIMSY